MNSNAKIGLFGTGLDTYWGQFDGLLDELKGYQARIRDRMERDAGVQVACVRYNGTHHDFMMLNALAETAPARAAIAQSAAALKKMLH